MLDVWGIAALSTKFSLYLGVLTATGTVLATFVFRLERHKNFTFFFALLGLFSAVIGFLLKGANLTGDVRGMTDPEILGLLWSTPVGTALLYHMVGLSLVLIGFFFRRGGGAFSLIGGILAIWSFTLGGHISGRESWILDLLLLFHLITVAFWIGILAPLKRMIGDDKTWPDAAYLGRRFGAVASITVPLLIVAGGVMGYLLVGTPANLFSTGYGQFLILKTLLVGSLLALAAANKLRFIPRLEQHDPQAASHLQKFISLEWLAFVAILGATAVLTTVLTLPSGG